MYLKVYMSEQEIVIMRHVGIHGIYLFTFCPSPGITILWQDRATQQWIEVFLDQNPADTWKSNASN